MSGTTSSMAETSTFSISMPGKQPPVMTVTRQCADRPVNNHYRNVFRFGSSSRQSPVPPLLHPELTSAEDVVSRRPTLREPARREINWLVVCS